MIGRTNSHYTITARLGEEGKGVVYRAEDAERDRSVALKFLAGSAVEDPKYKARFIREAKGAARLDHQNIFPIYEIDEVGGRPSAATPDPRNFLQPYFLLVEQRNRKKWFLVEVVTGWLALVERGAPSSVVLKCHRATHRVDEWPGRIL